MINPKTRPYDRVSLFSVENWERVIPELPDEIIEPLIAKENIMETKTVNLNNRYTTYIICGIVVITIAGGLIYYNYLNHKKKTRATNINFN